MFTWICPKCGGEVPPAYDDCPRCAPKKAAPKAEIADVPTAPAAAPPPPVELPPQAAPPAPVPRQTAPTPQPPPQRRMSAPAAALITFAGMAVLIAVLYLFVLPRQQHAATESPSPAATQIEPAASAAPAHPLAKYLEVAGVRLKGSPGGKVTIQFLVVNHSAADLPPMKMAVTLGSADRTYFEFGAAVPSLGPYEVKDMTTTATTDLKPYEMPDWQALRANFRITE